MSQIETTRALVTPKERNRISDEVVGFYRKGYSLRDIALELGCSKNKVRSDPVRSGQKSP